MEDVSFRDMAPMGHNEIHSPHPMQESLSMYRWVIFSVSKEGLQADKAANDGAVAVMVDDRTIILKASLLDIFLPIKFVSAKVK